MNDPLLVWRSTRWFPNQRASARYVCAIIAILVLLLPGRSAIAEAAAPVQADCLAIERAFAVNQMDALEALTPRDPQWQALRAFRLAAMHIPVGNKVAARSAVREGLAAVARGLKSAQARAGAAGGPAYRAELLLLGAMLDGQFLLIDRWRFVHNGLRGLRRLRQAERLVANNLRALLIRGTAKVVAPWALGGSAEEAVEILSRANLSAELCADGEWAQVDILNWLGRAQARLMKPDAAKSAYAAAWRRSPDNHWVRLALAGEGYEWTEHGELVEEPE